MWEQYKAKKQLKRGRVPLPLLASARKVRLPSPVPVEAVPVAVRTLCEVAVAESRQTSELRSLAW